jgi:hypothetical protein
MSVAELLQWAAIYKKTGVLEVERLKIRRRIAFRDGRIVGCSSDDPSMLLGQFLISRGKITDRQLRHALKRQRTEGGGMPDILVDMGVLTSKELEEQVAAKAKENICGLFEWVDAVFRFELGATPSEHSIAVDLPVEEILLNGAQRHDEVQRFHEVFTDAAVVLRRTEAELPDDVERDALLLQVLELIDGERTLAEVILRARASEYRVLKLLYELHSSRRIEIVGRRPDEEGASGEGGGSLHDLMEPADLHGLMVLATEKLEQGEPESALAILDACYRTRPGDEMLKLMIEDAEAALLESLREGPLAADRVPQRISTPDGLPLKKLSPPETALLELVDGETNIQSIVWTAPMRHVQVMRTLQRLYDKALIVTEETEALAGR